MRYAVVASRGVWRSLVARFVRDEEVVGSNPATPTRVADHRPGPALLVGAFFWLSPQLVRSTVQSSLSGCIERGRKPLSPTILIRMFTIARDSYSREARQPELTSAIGPIARPNCRARSSSQGTE